jgi:hypothetical protein
MMLPSWLEHCRYLPAWVVLHDHTQILWVNERLAHDNGKPAEWFVGKSMLELWTLGEIEPMEEHAVHAPDVVVDLRDRTGVLRWLQVHRTRIEGGAIFVVGRDVTADLKLHGLRLLLGRTLATGSRARLDEPLARQLLEGNSLDAICTTRGIDRAAAISQLALLVAEGPPPPEPSFVPPPLQPPIQPPSDLPDWLMHYEDLPVVAAVVEHPDLRVRWVNQHALGGQPAEAVIGRPVDELLADARDLHRLCDRAIAEQRPVDGVGAVRVRSNQQHWMVCRTTPLGGVHILVLEDDVTAEIRLQALRLLLGVDTAPTAGGAITIDPSFAQLLLAGADVANLCAALELSERDVLSRIGQLVGAGA